MSAPRVLVVEDEANIRELVCLHLTLEGFQCEPVGDGTEALRRATEHRYDLIVLDLMIPGIDGLTVCRAVRRQELNRDVPILMLTARREEADKVLGLESGADDYLTKPFGVRELVARVRALLRRSAGPAVGVAGTAAPSARPGAGSEADRNLPGSAEGAKPVRVHEIEIDVARRRVAVSGREVQLTAQEFRLLHLLATHPGIVFRREALLARVWEGETYVTARSVDTLVKRVRRKIERDSANPRLILTVWGTGYKLADV